MSKNIKGVGIDFSNKLIDLAKKNSKNLDFKCFDMLKIKSLKIKLKSFDYMDLCHQKLKNHYCLKF